MAYRCAVWVSLALASSACGGGGGGSPTDGPVTTGVATGSVLRDGQGVGGGVVTANRSGVPGRSDTPEATGVWRITGLLPGGWTITYAPGSGAALADGESGQRSVQVEANGTAVVPPFQLRPAPPQSGVVEVRLTTGSEFSPAAVTIAPGTRVRWINDGAVSHTITPENASQPGVWERRTTSSPGVVFEHVFTVAGQTYRYRCEPHSSSFASGMVGVITVQ